MSETSTRNPDPALSKDALYKRLHALSYKYFNGPFIHPDTRETVGRELRHVILTIDLRENCG